MHSTGGQTFQVRPRGFLYWHGILVIAVVVPLIGLLYAYYKLGPGLILGFLWIWLALTGFFGFLTLWAKSTYPTSITVFEDRVELHSIFGRREVRMDRIQSPTAVEGSYVWFGTSQDDGTPWTVMRVNGRVARIILASPKHPPWPVPPDLAQKIATLDS